MEGHLAIPQNDIIPIQMNLLWAATCLKKPLFLFHKGGCS